MMSTLELQSIVFIFSKSVMLTTFQDNRLPIYSLLGGSRCDVWSRVDLGLNTPYFLVRYEVEENGYRFENTTIVWQLASLLELCENKTGSTKTLQVALISPAAINSSKGWQMSDLQEIWETMEINSGTVVTTYVSTTGEKFGNRIDATHAEQFDDAKLVFSRTWTETSNASSGH